MAESSRQGRRGAGAGARRKSAKESSRGALPGDLESALTEVLAQLREYAMLMRLHRPIGIWLLMWPMLWALWIAGEGRPEGRLFLIFMIGAVVTRSAGCIINDVADRDFDPHVARTRDRPLAARRVGVAEALALFVALGLVAIGLALQLDRQTQLLAVAGGLLLVVYPFIKRYLSVPQLVLGAAFGWAVPMAFTAQAGALTQTAWLTFAIAVVWAVIYDTFYAMADREDDLRIGVKSTAVLFGEADRFVIGALQLVMLLGLALLGDLAGLGLWYYASLAVAAVFMAWQQWLARERDPQRCFRAFLNNHYVGMTIFIGVALDYLFRFPT